MAKNRYQYSYISRKEMRHTVYIVVAFICALCLLCLLVSTFFVFSLRINSNSMTPRLEKGDLVMLMPLRTSENGLTGFSRPHRGDLVLIEPQYPAVTSFWAQAADAVAGFFTFQQIHPFSDSRRMGESATLRRLLGMPGDTIYMDNFVLYVKPEGSIHFFSEFELTESDGYDIYVDKLPAGWEKNAALSGMVAETVLGPGEYFVLADDRVKSFDSRMWGPIPARRIQAKAFLRYWPFNAFSVL